MENELLLAFSFNSEKGFDEKDYVYGEINRHWSALTRSTTLSGVSYEDRIRTFITAQKINFPVLILVGSEGSGKTAACRHLLKTSFSCRNSSNFKCTRGPIKITIDFNSRESNDSKEAFWSHIEGFLACEIKKLQIPNSGELLNFWKWCMQAEVYRDIILHQNLRTTLNTYEKDILAGNERIIADGKRDLMKKINPEGLCYYRIAELAYECYKKSGPRNNNNTDCLQHDCTVVLFDNLDHLSSIQLEIIERFANELATRIPARVIIMIRPYTLTRNSFGNRNIFYLDHHSAPPKKVLQHRITRFIEKGGSREVESVLRDLQTHFWEEQNFNSIVQNVCGDNLRIFINSLHNLLVSPSLQLERRDNCLTQYPKHLIIEAYMCNRNRVLDTDLVDNIFNVKGYKTEKRHIVKYSILRFLFLSDNSFAISKQWISLKELSVFICEIMKISGDLFADAINEMLYMVRPLIWTRFGHRFHYKDNALIPVNREFIDSSWDVESQNTVHLSSIGATYLQSLMNNPYYIKECVYDINREFSANEKDSMRTWTEKALTLVETVALAERNLMDVVRADYGEDAVSILRERLSLRSWANNLSAVIKNMQN